MHFQPAWCRVALGGVDDAVITADTAEERVTFLDPAAESPTDWTQDEAAGFSLERIFNIINRDPRKTVESPTVRALRDGAIGLANHTLRWSG